MSINATIRTVAALAAVAGLSVTGVASAATVHRTGGPIVKPVVATSTAVPEFAFPTGGKGSGTEATCELWSGELAYDHGALDAAVHNNDLAQYQEAQAQLDDDTDNALDAGCVVID